MTKSNTKRPILMAALLMMAISFLIVSSASGSGNTGIRTTLPQITAEKGHSNVVKNIEQNLGDRALVRGNFNDATDPNSVRWETLEYTERSVGTTDSVTIWSMSSSQKKYCAPVVQDSTIGTIKGALIDLETGQQVQVIWYLDGAEKMDFMLNLDASPYFSTMFPDGATATTIDPFNAIGTHIIKVEVKDLSNTLLASDEKSYEIVSCSDCSLTLGPASSQCLGVLPDNIPGNISRGGSSEIHAYWTDESENTLSVTIPEGSFNAVESVPPLFINNIYNTSGFHFLRLDAPLDFFDPASPYVSNTVTFYIQPCSGTYYVNIESGDDSNAGSSSYPWKTLHHAISQINGGVAGTYTLIMAAGTYSKATGEAVAALILTQDNVTILGADDRTIGAGTTLIDGTGTSVGDWISGINFTGSNATIRGLSIKNFSAAGQYGIYMSASTGTEVVNCKISNNNTGIEIAAGSNAFKIRGCEIYSNTTDGLNVTSSTDGEIYRNTIYLHQGADADGVYVHNCSPAIKRNKIYDNKTGIRVRADGGNTASPAIGNNVIYENTTPEMNYGILVKADTSATASPAIHHNSIDGGTGDGIAIENISTGGTLAPVIKYNIITRCDEYGIDAVASATCTIDYNDVWHNGPLNRGTKADNYNNCDPGANDLYGETQYDGLGKDPKNGVASQLASDSPCIDAIPTNVGDDAIMDYPGYKRPKGSGYDMGAYEYIATQTDTHTLSGGTGVVTDYEIFTVPLYVGTGLDMRNFLTDVLGGYDPTKWRVFARTTSGDIEMNTQAFASLEIEPGMGFWGITVLTDTISFQGTLAPDAIYYKIELAPGWHLFAVPWPNTTIDLGKIYVTDGVNEYTITNASNTLTEQKIWDYTGSGPDSGYVQRSASDFSLADGTGYFIKVLGSSNIILSIPPDNSSDPPNNSFVSTSQAVRYESLESVRLLDDSEPPPLPDGSYGPMPDIKANGKSGPLTVSRGTPVSITVSLDPGNRPLKKADWWVVAHTPFVPPNNCYSYVYPKGWQPGIHVCVQMLPFQIPPSFEVLNMALPVGDYTIYFAVDENADGIVDETWVDSVDVRVE